MRENFPAVRWEVVLFVHGFPIVFGGNAQKRGVHLLEWKKQWQRKLT
ncbi:Uncharacterised protein [Corynebacterium ulcerans]|nr:Uncharacterised protein [Corynebacterium ulcerans]